MFGDVGLTADDLAVYRALLLAPRLSLADITQSVGRSESDVRAALDRLARLGLLQPSQDADGDLRAASPDVTLARLVTELSLDLQQRQSRLAGLQLEAAKLSEDYREARRTASANVLEELVSRDRVVSALGEVIGATTGELLVMVTNRQNDLALQQARETDERVLARGVVLKGIYVDAVNFDKPTVRYLEWMIASGAQVRTHPAPPIRMVISDRHTAVVARDPDDPSRGALLVRAPGLVHALVSLHDQTWRVAAPFGAPAAAGEGDQPTSVELEILRLLAQGQKDDSVARALAMSVRTLRRLIGELAHRVGARSRFELGVVARDHGWI